MGMEKLLNRQTSKQHIYNYTFRAKSVFHTNQHFLYLYSDVSTSINNNKTIFHMQLKLARQLGQFNQFLTNQHNIKSKYHILHIHQENHRKITTPFANVGRCMSRTFPRIGKIRESTPFQRGMNSKAVLDL
jgi:hypothetical protein